MKLYQLRNVLEVEKTGNFSKAAKNLNVTQPTLSKSISLLEEEVGFQIFVRARAGAKLTEEGKILAEKAVKLVQYADEVDKFVEMIKTGRSQAVIGITPVLGSLLIPEIEKKLASEDMVELIRWVEEDAGNLSEKLNSGSVDIVIGAADMINSKADKFTVTDLCTMDEVVCTSTDNPLSGKKNVSEKDLDGSKLIACHGYVGPESMRYLAKSCEVINIREVTTAMALVHAYKGIMFIYKPLFDKYKDEYGLAELKFSPKIEHKIIFASKKNLASKVDIIEKMASLIK